MACLSCARTPPPPTHALTRRPGECPTKTSADSLTTRPRHSPAADNLTTCRVGLSPRAEAAPPTTTHPPGTRPPGGPVPRSSRRPAPRRAQRDAPEASGSPPPARALPVGAGRARRPHGSARAGRTAPRGLRHAGTRAARRRPPPVPPPRAGESPPVRPPWRAGAAGGVLAADAGEKWAGGGGAGPGDSHRHPGHAGRAGLALVAAVVLGLSNGLVGASNTAISGPAISWPAAAMVERALGAWHLAPDARL